MLRARMVSGALLVLTATLGSCIDLRVTNPNAPDAQGAIGDGATAEAVVGGAFNTWFDAANGYWGAGMLLSTTAFQYSTPYCQASHYSWLPRRTVDDETSPYGGWVTYPWYTLYEALMSVADGLRAVESRPDLQSELGEAGTQRIMAFGRFVQGLSHGSLALLYDRGVVLDENVAHDETAQREILSYNDLMATALSELEDAAALAQGKSWEIPADWTTVPVSADQLARLAHSFAARFRAAVARTPEERAAVDWAAVIADVDEGIQESWIMDMDATQGWRMAALEYGTRQDWAEEAYFIVGMADQSGSYQRWLSMPVVDRIPNPDTDGDGVEDPVLIITPDSRFPQGATLAEQEANPGSMFAIPNGLQGQVGGHDRAWDIKDVWTQAARGTWRWSYYTDLAGEAYDNSVDWSWPEVSLAEMRLLKAEGLLRQGDAAGAAQLVNVSRTAAGLRPTDGSGTNLDCVPKLPDGTCGDLMEMLKWEKRLETRFKGLFGAPWYFDGRGWGDLYVGTFLQLPVPCSELKRGPGIDCYTFGGGGEGSAPMSVYGWPYER